MITELRCATEFPPMPVVLTDGGRAAAGFKGSTRDCVCRAVAIITEQPYREVYEALNSESKKEHILGGRRRSSARNGVQKSTVRRYLERLGFEWVPKMEFGKGCTTHLCAAELPAGRLIVQVSKHVTAVIDGVIHDNHDPQRGGSRCVYGYWRKA